MAITPGIGTQRRPVGAEPVAVSESSPAVTGRADHPAATRRSIERTSADGSVPVSSISRRPVVLVRAERLGLAPVARERLDLQTSGAVAQRVSGDVRFERGDRLAGAASGD